MSRCVRVLVLVAATTLLAVPPEDARALLSPADVQCQHTIAKEGLRLVKGRLDIERHCRKKELQRPGRSACDARAVRRKRTMLTTRFTTRVASDCGRPLDATRLGFPGRCVDPDESDGFSATDVAACLIDAAERVLFGICGGGANDGEGCHTLNDCPDSGPGTSCVGVLSAEYDSTVVGPLGRDVITCQQAIATAMGRFFVTFVDAVARCRDDILKCSDGPLECGLEGLDPAMCGVSDSDTVATIEKARERARATIGNACSEPVLLAIRPCEPNQTTIGDTIDCELAVHTRLAEHFLGFVFPGPSVCGNGRVDGAGEECDGRDDAACPGRCGGVGSLACLCTDRPRMLVIEGADGDLDVGWGGGWHDAQLVHGGGYVADLADCDGPWGPDTVCAVGPSCSQPPHVPCSPPAGQPTTADAMCPGPGNHCRTTAAAATGPHCAIEFKRRCRDDRDCVQPGDRCRTVAHGPPLPLAAGGVSVCVVAQFSEDVTGTIDLATGAGAVRMRERVATTLGGSLAQPCPVCGGFCAGAATFGEPGARTLCTSDADCPSSRCVTEPVCSYGARVDQPCRTAPAVGGPTEQFGTTSVDCPPSPNSLHELDLLFNPLATATAHFPASRPCRESAAGSGECVGGPNAGRPCADGAECPSGACRPQCYCIDQPRPNACAAACVGGTHDAAPCAGDAECDPPTGFCHPADCRVDPADTDSAQEGVCTVGPGPQMCSVHRFVECAVAGDCRPPACPFCDPDEACTSEPQACFVNGEVVRAGMPGVPERVNAGVSCLASTGSYLLDTSIGLPGPVAITRPETFVVLGF